MAFRSISLSPKIGRNFFMHCFRGDTTNGLKNARAMSMTSSEDDKNRRELNDKGPNFGSHFEIPPSVQGYQGGEHEFSHNQSLEVVSAAVEYHFKARKSNSDHVEPGSSVNNNRSSGQSQSGSVEETGSSQDYDNSGHVSLSSCMQTTVPEPFTPAGRSPVHLNMPRQGRTSSEQKYIADKLEHMHPSRQFSTSAAAQSPVTYNTKPLHGDYESEPCPQGIQGDDCVQFQLWLDSCRRYGLSNCEDQLQGIQTGRKRLGEVLREQDILIAKIAAEYKASQASNGDGDTFEGMELDGPCPQGIQGEDCDRFKIWFKNCHQFGFGNCDENLQGIQTGRKSLSQVFQEQDELIQNITKKNYTTSSGQVGIGGFASLTRSFSTKPDPGSNHSDPNPTSPEVKEKLSQKDRLKRAVKDYGATVIVFHVGISLMSLGGFYVLVSSGIDIVAILRKLGVGESLVSSNLLAGASTFVVAYAVHKVFAPARIAITLTSTPFIVRYLRRIGFLKAPKPS